MPEGVLDGGWPFIRGATFDGHSPEIHLADQWPEAGPPILWRRELGQGYSAFVAHGRRVLTQAQTLAGQVVLCLDADSGETLWEHRYDSPYEAVGVYPGPRSTPTIAGSRVVFASPSGLIGCLDLRDGRPLWSVNVVEKYGGKGAEFGYACSPTVVGERVILPVGGSGASLVALSLADGREVWKSGNDQASYTPAYPIRRAGRDCVVGYLQNSLVVYDLSNGEQLVRFDLSQGYDEHSAWPIYREPFLWIAEPFRAGSMLLEIPDVSGVFEPKLRTVWKKSQMSNDIMSSVLVGDHVYGFDIIDVQAKTHRPSRGIFRCVNFETGQESWSVGTGRPQRDSATKEPGSTPHIGQAGVIVADNKLILFNELGELILARASSERYDELARASVLSGELVWTPPMLHRGRVYLRNHQQAVCVFVGDPKLLSAETKPLLSGSGTDGGRYRDWSATILPYEPEYAFDVPADELFVFWWQVGLGLLLLGQVIGAGFGRWFAGSRRAFASLAIGWGVAFVAGCLGTTLLSSWWERFCFTWPVALFVAFEVVIANARSRTTKPALRQRLIEYGGLLFCVATSFAYFLLCRRLSLLFEWVFLVGPLASLPLSYWSIQQRRKQTIVGLGLSVMLELVAFTAFFAASVAVLKWKY